MTDNRLSATAAKIKLRRAAIEWVGDADVFDAFCGDGCMARQAWSDARSYVGCDAKWTPWPQRKRFAADNRRVLRAIDLAAFNVFDLDAYGSPWEQALIVADRREWKPGERGALVLTDGSSMRLRFGKTTPAIAALVPALCGTGQILAAATQRALPSAWARRAGVRLERHLVVESESSGHGAQHMRYSALFFSGRVEA